MDARVARVKTTGTCLVMTSAIASVWQNAKAGSLQKNKMKHYGTA